MIAMLKWLVIAVVVLALAGFSVVNRHLIALEFYPLPYQIELPVYLLILIAFFLGFLLAWLLGRLHAIRLAHRARKAEHKTDALKEEVTRLKHQPKAISSH